MAEEELEILFKGEKNELVFLKAKENACKLMRPNLICSRMGSLRLHWASADPSHPRDHTKAVPPEVGINQALSRRDTGGRTQRSEFSAPAPKRPHGLRPELLT